MPKCKNCGESLHPEQKVCLACGTQTDRWPGRVAEEEEKPAFPVSPKLAAAIGGGLLVIIIVIVLVMHFRIVPPHQVTEKWLQATTSRNLERAREYTLPAYEDSYWDQSVSSRKADEYQLFIYNNEADYTISKPDYESKESASVLVIFKGKNGEELRERVKLVLENRKWKIADIGSG